MSNMRPFAYLVLALAAAAVAAEDSSFFEIDPELRRKNRSIEINVHM